MENKDTAANLVVALKAKDVKNSKAKNFDIKHANALLSTNNSQWELADEKFNWNGSELVKATETKAVKKA